MKTCIKCGLNKPLNLFYVRNKKTGTLRNSCIECEKYKATVWYESNKQKASFRAADYYIKNKTKIKEKSKAYYLVVKNTEKYKSYYKQWAKTWRQQNLAKRAFKESIRRTRKLNASPVWLSKQHLFEIKKIYKMAQYLSKICGFPAHVDHIIPLQGKNVCGLHVPWNLQILTQTENISKLNRVG